MYVLEPPGRAACVQVPQQDVPTAVAADGEAARPGLQLQHRRRVALQAAAQAGARAVDVPHLDGLVVACAQHRAAAAVQLDLRHAGAVPFQVLACGAAPWPQAQPAVHAARHHSAVRGVRHASHPLRVAALFCVKRAAEASRVHVYAVQRVVAAADDRLARGPVHTSADVGPVRHVHHHALRVGGALPEGAHHFRWVAWHRWGTAAWCPARSASTQGRPAGTGGWLPGWSRAAAGSQLVQLVQLTGWAGAGRPWTRRRLWHRVLPAARRWLPLARLGLAAGQRRRPRCAPHRLQVLVRLVPIVHVLVVGGVRGRGAEPGRRLRHPTARESLSGAAAHCAAPRSKSVVVGKRACRRGR
mmetsp:Transcript_9248/g.23367  ORF Transcript_9248/g.23367 Transcript_9248/m.23367 type:complete len:357 (+) Transcript_9248:745-1815(+)